MRRQFYVYILANSSRMLYIGVTSNLHRRLQEHRAGVGSSFCFRYRLRRLVYVEATDDVYAAISREKELKRWRREKKVALIVRANPQWRDLARDLGY
jgi:putative endonuclease